MDPQTKKRTRKDYDNEQAESESTGPFARFLIIESLHPEKPLAKLSPFVIEKVLVSLAGSPKSVKKLKNGTLLVEVEKPQHSKNLLALKRFFDLPAKCTTHGALNSSRGVIRCPDLAGVDEEEIVTELSTQNVIEARRIRVFRDGVRRDTNTIVLKFKTAILPKTLKVGYMKVPVDLYIPNPLQCYRCFKFGHHERQCNADDHCKRCSANENETHHSEPCTRSPKCLNCGEEHYSTSRSCKVSQREKEIITIKYRESLSFAEARKIIDTRHALGSSYSSVTKSNIAKSVTLKDAQTQTNDASVQTEIPQKQTSTTVKHQQPVSNKKPDKPVRNKSPNKSSDRVLSDRLPKGSDDPIQQHNRFHCLDEEDMEADNDHAEIHTNKQGRIIKLNNKK